MSNWIEMSNGSLLDMSAVYSVEKGDGLRRKNDKTGNYGKYYKIVLYISGGGKMEFEYGHYECVEPDYDELEYKGMCNKDYEKIRNITGVNRCDHRELYELYT